MTDTEMYIGTEAGYKPVTVTNPIATHHGIETYGVDGLVLTGTAETDWTTKALSWSELRDSGYTPYVGGARVSFDVVRQSIPGTDQPE
jgi:hypothetical protein